MRLEPFKAFLTKDRVAVVMVRGSWRQRISAADLPRWISLYRRLWSRTAKGHGDSKTPGLWASFYAQPIETLENLLKQMEMK